MCRCSLWIKFNCTNFNLLAMFSIERSLLICAIIAALIDIRFSAKPNLVATNSKANYSNTKDNGAFDPCRYSKKVTAAAKKYLKNALASMMSACALSLFTALHLPWGSAKDVLAFARHVNYRGCMTIRIIYAVFSNEADRLPRALSLNATPLFDAGVTMLSYALSDYSISDKMCVHNVRPGNRSVCYTKKSLLRLAITGLPCVQKVLQNRVPESVDTALLMACSWGIRMSKSKFIAYTRK